MHKRICFFILFALCWSCGTKTSSGVLSEEEMVDIITDLQLADAAYKLEMLPPDYLQNPQLYYLEILQKHNTDSSAYRKSLNYYLKDPQDLKRIYEKVDLKIKGMANPPHQLQ